ncbi:methyl-accepting chemotaxis protein [Clostridium cellulovorans]|uniref:Methyl-accepting chemotaxis sensory transducer n=1 Tax=Clostridium cellulovorans (strain ATCC 35296 / DSM 3052 / OCM 3 / 743B) TaxID=573061 RepID=D9SR59_CLOC7|nr:methyl-accepting chemotaxis protein [Clostridium cellulovorans]ADL50347.1 methyl-accepting chemotaxis sensory transducer [Clostridium cellulovorans 743B]
MKGFKMRGKILILVIALILSTGITSLVIGYSSSSSLAKDGIYEELTSVEKMTVSLINEKYPGDWKLDGNKLYKGDNLINEDNEFVDFVKEQTNCEITIFRKDTRIVTTISEDGKRIVGTTAKENVVSTVIDNKKDYQGNVEISGEPFLVKYSPIVDSKGNAIGMVFIGKENSDVRSMINSSIALMLIATVVISILAYILSAIIVKKIINPIIISIECLKKVANGDLTLDIPEDLTVRHDEAGELAKAVQNMQKSLKAIVTNIKKVTGEVYENSENLLAISEEMSATSDNISHAVQEMASGSTSQAQDLSTVTEALNDFGDKIEDTKESVSVIYNGSVEIGNMTSSSNEDMKNVVNSINSVKSEFDGFTHKIQGLGDNIKRINEITEAINSIAQQTNLLALNAAIEAARAGESGRGFAVVAEEIRKLAEQSSESSDNIKALVESISKDADNIVHSSTIVNDQLTEQLDVIDNTIVSFKKITKSIESIIPKMNGVNKATNDINESKDGILGKAENTAAIAEEISASSEEIAASTQEMNNAACQVAKSAEELTLQTKRLIEEIEVFKVEK